MIPAPSRVEKTMTFGQITLMVFGLFMLAGGFMGLRAGSRASIYAGSGSAALLLVALLVTLFNMTLGLGIGLVVAAGLCVVFVARFLKTGKFMPAGMLLVVSIAAVVLLAFSVL